MSKPFAAFKSPRTLRPSETDETRAIVEKLARVAPPLIRRGLARGTVTPATGNIPARHSGPINIDAFHDSTGACTFMSRLAHDTLQLLGITGVPLDVRVEAWTKEYATWRETGVDHPRAYRHTNDPNELLRDGVAFHSWITHLVILVPASQQIIDLAAWQMSRPQWGLLLPPALALPWDGEQAIFTSATGHISYQRWPSSQETAEPIEERRDWSESYAWTLRGLAKVIAKQVR